MTMAMTLAEADGHESGDAVWTSNPENRNSVWHRGRPDRLPAEDPRGVCRLADGHDLSARHGPCSNPLSRPQRHGILHEASRLAMGREIRVADFQHTFSFCDVFYFHTLKGAGIWCWPVFDTYLFFWSSEKKVLMAMDRCHVPPCFCVFHDFE
jgi:hypothetical protein